MEALGVIFIGPHPLSVSRRSQPPVGANAKEMLLFLRFRERDPIYERYPACAQPQAFLCSTSL